MLFIIFIFNFVRIVIGEQRDAQNCNDLSSVISENGATKPNGNAEWEEREWVHKSGQLFLKALIRPILKQNDSQIFHGHVLDFPNNNKEIGLLKNIAIKEVFFGVAEHKTKEKLFHEVEMLKMANRMNAKYVVKLFDYIVLPNSLVMVMELGEETLNGHLKRLRMKWEEHKNFNTIISDIKPILNQMVIALQDLHRFAIHLSLKSENWLFINRKDEKILALIDFQTSVPVSRDGKVDISSKEKLVELRKYMCTLNSQALLVKKSIYDSPEHMQFCETHEKKEISVQTDIWSLGISLLEFLAYTPQIDVFFKELDAKKREKNKTKMLRLMFVEEKGKKHLVKKWIFRKFPLFYKLIKKILIINPKKRLTAEKLLEMLK